MEENRLLDVKDLKVSFFTPSGEVKAVGGVSYHVDREEVIAIVGESGCGKSVTQMSVMQMIPDPPGKILGGEVWFEGKNLLKYKSKSKDMRSVRGAQISMIFQDPMTALNPVKRVGEQIAEGIRQHQKISRAEALNRACDMLNMVGISDDRVNDYPHQFSGGMKQRVVIAMALACSPDLLLADEPTTALDVTIQAQVLEMIKALRDKMNTAMIMITHDLGVVADVADDAAVVYAGEIIEYGSKEAVYDNPSHPYTQGLFFFFFDLSKEVRRLNPIEGLPPDPVHLPEGCSFHSRCPHATEECRKHAVPLREMEPGHLTRCLKAGAVQKKED